MLSIVGCAHTHKHTHIHTHTVVNKCSVLNVCTKCNRALTFQNICQVVDVDPAVLDADTRAGWGNEPSGTHTHEHTHTYTHTHT